MNIDEIIAKDTLVILYKQAKLKDREKDIIENRYMDKLSLTETAKKWGVSRERIRQVESVALNKLRKAWDKIEGWKWGENLYRAI